MEECSVAIVGGGLSGTYLAYLLNNKRIDFQLLEAKPTLGGRILSALPDDVSSSFDLGPTWFWSHQYRIKTLLEFLGIEAFEQYADGDVLYQLNPSQGVQRSAGAEVLPSFRVRGGMQRLIDKLAATLAQSSLCLSSTVTHVKKIDVHWQVTMKDNQNEKTILAKQLVFAMPPRVLLNTVTIEPELPEGLVDQLINTPTWMAAQAKCIAVYKTPFWREAGLSGEIFSRVGPLVEIHDASSINKNSTENDYALFGFLGLPANARSQFSAEAIKKRCVDQLAAILGEQARDVRSVFLKDWSQDTFVSTDRDNNEPPVHPYCDLAAYEKVLQEMAISFSATEYASTEAGYLEGALAAAEAAAAKLVNELLEDIATKF